MKICSFLFFPYILLMNLKFVIEIFFEGIRVIVHGEGFLIFQEMKIQKLLWTSVVHILNWESVCTST